VTIPKPLSELTPSQAGLPFEPHWIHCPDGPKLAAWHCPQANAKAVIILLHGYAADKSCLINVAAAYGEMGLATLLVDFRGSGFSSESYTTIGVREALDVVAAYRYASNELRYSKILLHGQSMGAAALLRAIHEYSLTPEAIVVEAVFDSLLTTTKNRF
jgi:alpha-beta hydrolase superfamily lysophospholipase